MAELNSVILGAKAEIGFNDNWNELFTGVDTLNLRYTLPNFKEGQSAYTIETYALTSGGGMMPVYSRESGRTAAVKPEPLMPGRYEVVAGSEKGVYESGARIFSVDIKVNRAVYRKVQTQLRYWPDGSDEQAVLEIAKVATD